MLGPSTGAAVGEVSPLEADGVNLAVVVSSGGILLIVVYNVVFTTVVGPGEVGIDGKVTLNSGGLLHSFKLV